jgi:hypothetical protein
MHKNKFYDAALREFGVPVAPVYDVRVAAVRVAC